MTWSSRLIGSSVGGGVTGGVTVGVTGGVTAGLSIFAAPGSAGAMSADSSIAVTAPARGARLSPPSVAVFDAFGHAGPCAWALQAARNPTITSATRSIYIA